MGDGHSSGVSVTGHLARPTRATARRHAFEPQSNCRPYSVLLPVWFALPPPLPAARCAFTAPFHPYLPYPKVRRRFSFCGTFPEVAPAGCYPAPCFRGARTFLPSRVSLLRRATIRPSGTENVTMYRCRVKQSSHKRLLVGLFPYRQCHLLLRDENDAEMR